MNAFYLWRTYKEIKFNQICFKMFHLRRRACIFFISEYVSKSVVRPSIEVLKKCTFKTIHRLLVHKESIVGSSTSTMTSNKLDAGKQSQLQITPGVPSAQWCRIKSFTRFERFTFLMGGGRIHYNSTWLRGKILYQHGSIVHGIAEPFCAVSWKVWRHWEHLTQHRELRNIGLFPSSSTWNACPWRQSIICYERENVRDRSALMRSIPILARASHISEQNESSKMLRTFLFWTYWDYALLNETM